MAMFTGYFDESGTHGDSKVLCVAGLISTVEQWTEFQREWREALDDAGVSYFRMALFENRLKDFADWDNAKRHRVLRRLTGIIKRRVYFGVGRAVLVSDFHEAFEGRHKYYYGEPYRFCSFMSMLGIGAWQDKHDRHDLIPYVFEKGAHGSSNLTRFFSWISGNPEIKQRARLSSLTFADKKEVLPLQAADLVAYEFYKGLLNDKVLGGKRPTRKSIKLLRGLPLNFGYFNKERLSNMAADFDRDFAEEGGEIELEGY
jgi:hypothetical protein